MVSQYKKPIVAYRIGDSRYPVFSGEGAQKYGARWNPIGRAAIYASLNLSCAMLELLTRLNDIPVPDTHMYIEITSAEKEVTIEEVERADFKTWDLDDIYETQEYGNKWLAELRSVILIVPSIIVPIEKNVVINPNHSDFKKLKASTLMPIKWDPRLF